MIIKKKGRVSITKGATIDLTPVIDSVFLLLIFFMVTTVFIDVRALLVDLPSPGDNSEDQQKKKDVNVTVSVEGNYTVNGASVSAESLAGALKGAMDMNNNKSVIIQGDPLAPQKFIVYAMDQAKSVGAEAMAFVLAADQGAAAAPSQ
jgi:biopolymer transport protein ExbD